MMLICQLKRVSVAFHAGTHNSTAEVEHELMDLWNAVEKDRVLQANRKAAAARSRTRQDPSQPPLKKVLVPALHVDIYQRVLCLSN